METKLIANLENATNRYNAFYRKEKNGFYLEKTVIVYNPNKTTGYYSNFEPVLTVRFYCPSSVVYCCFWLRSSGVDGYGKASGCGYDKKSAAFASALDGSNIEIFKNDKRYDFGGSGTEAIEAVMLAIVNSMPEYKDLDKYIHTANP